MIWEEAHLVKRSNWSVDAWKLEDRETVVVVLRRK
jgi:hypothetical protein